MEPESSCGCSTDALQILTEVRNVDAVVEFETILDLVQRVYNQGQVMLNCKACRKLPPQTSSFITIPALTDHCLSLFEAVCSAYSITPKSCLFDANILAFEQPLPQFICIRSKVQLGETDLDEAETGMLVRTLLCRNSMRLLSLLEALKGILRTFPTDNTQVHPAGAATLRAYESSIQSTMHRFVSFLDQIKVEQRT
ncbi:hypothetical protein BDV38DRAFT_233861 [Aspergillus pseudotamarii]|uniref:AflR-like C6 transcription factor n=1 Tax=Aspergillus pseudotamarii TaxID=132259 RepID=A0A5N6TB50_ASPPS|nr:uncharacterized protein BDV38DRAFT_233861 [Aspergillus pseudotamarii]KAE8143516.1 hypothetical protein BDV38DRAFT_233861 [Aspergillus pseudotamarii]